MSKPSRAVNGSSVKGMATTADIEKAKALERNPDGTSRFLGCSKFGVYEMLGKLGEGTFGEVHKARHVKKGHLVALKKILMHNEKDGFPITALREIKLLKMLSHENVLKLEEMAVEHRRGEGKKKACMYMVTPYMDHDLSGLLENPTVRITEPQIKCYMLQLLEGVRYLHSMQILHRDMKAANLLINNKGILQIADFGLARPYDELPPQPGKGGGEATREYTSLVVTRWYRPPELLLQLRKYTTAIDMWGVGCVFGEMFKKKPIMSGKSDLNQLTLIFELVGSPTEQNMPGWSELPGFQKEGVTSYGNQKGRLPIVFREQGSGAISLLTLLLTLDWRKRINAIDALKHEYFTTSPLPARPGDLPQFEESHELDRRKFRDHKAALPPAPAGGTVGMGMNGGEWGSGQANSYGNRRPYGPPPHAPQPRRTNHDSRMSQQRRPPAPEHQPAWNRGTRGNAGNSGPDLALPPRPPTNASWSTWAGEHNEHRRPRHAPRDGAPGHPPVDTYIPSYGNGEARNRYDGPPRHDRDRARNIERGGVYDGSRRRSRSPISHPSKDQVRDRGREVYRR